MTENSELRRRAEEALASSLATEAVNIAFQDKIKQLSANLHAMALGAENDEEFEAALQREMKGVAVARKVLMALHKALSEESA